MNDDWLETSQAARKRLRNIADEMFAVAADLHSVGLDVLSRRIGYFAEGVRGAERELATAGLQVEPQLKSPPSA